MTKTLIERFEEKYIGDPNSGCWIWTACLLKGGYGLFAGGSKRESGTGNKLVLAHRFSYEFHVGPIPVGLELDHKCRTRACVNPNHLEPVTKAENFRRGTSPTVFANYRSSRRARTHCKRGHAYVDHVYMFTDRQGKPHRHCKECWKLRRKIP